MHPLRTLAIAIAVLIPFYARAAEIKYTFTDIGRFAGGPFNVAQGINNQGQVVGGGFHNGAGRAWIYSSGTFTDLGPFGADNAFATGINDSGQIAVTAERTTGPTSASTGWIYHNGQSRMLPTSAGAYTGAYDINNAGVAVGYASANPGSPRAAVFQGNTATSLGTLSGTGASYAHAINSHGTIVGDSNVNFSVPFGGLAYHAFVYQNGQMTDLGTLGGHESRARDINDKGQIVGESFLLGTSRRRAFLHEGGTMKDLGTLPGTPEFLGSSAQGINEQGQVVGYSEMSSTVRRAFVWENGTMFDLNDLVTLPAGWTLSEALDINDEGDIVGFGRNPQGLQHAFLLEALDLPDPPPPAVPLPAALVPGAALGAYVISRRRRRYGGCANARRSCAASA